MEMTEETFDLNKHVNRCRGDGPLNTLSLTRRQWLRLGATFGSAVIATAASGAEAGMTAAQRDRLVLMLRRRGVRGGLDFRVGALLGVHNRGENLLASRMSAKSGNAIVTFGRVIMRHRELYYWGFQPDYREMTTYFFLSNYKFELVARGAMLKDNDVSVIEDPRRDDLFAEALEGWSAVLAAAGD